MSNLLHHEVHFQHRQYDWLVFIHGAGGSLVTWKRQVNSFKPFFNLLLIDLRDHGASKNLEPEYDSYNFDIVTDDILHLLDHLEMNQAHFMSLSMGSIILQRLADRRPELIKSMVMAGGVFKADWKIKMFAHSGKLLSYILPFRLIYDSFIMIVLPRANHRASRRIYRMTSKSLTPKEFLKWLGLYRDLFKVVKRFYRRKLTIESLVVMGSQDHVFLNSAKRYVGKQADKAELVILENCGHLCNLEAAQLFNETVLNFLQCLNPKATMPAID